MICWQTKWKHYSLWNVANGKAFKWCSTPKCQNKSKPSEDEWPPINIIRCGLFFQFHFIYFVDSFSASERKLIFNLPKNVVFCYTWYMIHWLSKQINGHLFGSVLYHRNSIVKKKEMDKKTKPFIYLTISFWLIVNVHWTLDVVRRRSRQQREFKVH